MEGFTGEVMREKFEVNTQGRVKSNVRLAVLDGIQNKSARNSFVRLTQSANSLGAVLGSPAYMREVIIRPSDIKYIGMHA